MQVTLKIRIEAGEATILETLRLHVLQGILAASGDLCDDFDHGGELKVRIFDGTKWDKIIN